MALIVDGHGILIYGSGRFDMHNMLVGGRVVIDDGRLTTADGPAIVREAQAVAGRLWAAAGRRPLTWTPNTMP